jgi:hypothetical protein
LMGLEEEKESLRRTAGFGFDLARFSCVERLRGSAFVPMIPEAV